MLMAAASVASAAGKKPADKPRTEKKTMTTPAEEWKGQYGGPLEPGHILVSDLKGWKALVAQLKLDAHSPDFTKSVVVAVFVGEHPTGGFTAAFEEPAVKGDDMVVRYRIKKPSPTSFVTQAIAQPWKVRVFPRPKGKVDVEPLPE
ncbi:MAG: hypothetical protein A2506_11720 [Elusimicrobia bacterium RIFOXYD12_FULL_66_9]|nr:MAG: hypothetical protein A2506_11720 [Elusimicrobia bacterium RIFOXYD12_FULL_66_9]